MIIINKINPELLLISAALLLITSISFALLSASTKVKAKEEMSEVKSLSCSDQAWPRIAQNCFDDGNSEVRVIQRVFVRES